MTLIEEIDENNFEYKNKEGEKRVDFKIRKFERQVESSKISEKGKGMQNPVENKEHVDLYALLDPTIWAYKFLRDKQNKPLILRGFQDNIINDKHRFIVCAAANQIGKTWTACIKAIHHALHVNNASVIIVSRSEQQAINVLDEIKWMLKRASIDFDSVIGDVENRTEIHLISPDKIGTSVIRCLPPTTGILGFLATLIICDEIAFWEIDSPTMESSTKFFHQVIVSRTNATKSWKNDFFRMGQIFCISNPNGQQGIMWDLWNDADFHQFRFNFLSNPENSLEEYNMWKTKMPDDWFDSQYAAVFSSASGGFITLDEWNGAVRDYSAFPPITVPIYFGGDFAGEDTVGRNVDSTILIGVENIKEEEKNKIKLIYHKEFPLRVKKEDVYEELRIYPNINKFCYDKPGVGDSVKNDLIDKNILSEMKIESLSYSLPNKSEVYYNLKHLFEQRRIILPNIQKLKEQLMGLRFKRTTLGHLQKPVIIVHHVTEGVHDDWADALANACYAARLTSPIPSIAIIQKGNNEKISNSRYVSLVCPKCEETDLNGNAGYYRGISQNGKINQRILCPIHQ